MLKLHPFVTGNLNAAGCTVKANQCLEIALRLEKDKAQIGEIDRMLNLAAMCCEAAKDGRS